MTDGEHTFTKTGRQQRASYATICQWIVDAWANVSVSIIIQSFEKVGIILNSQATTMRLTLITITTRLIQACLMLKSRNCSTLTLKMNNLMDFWERIPLNNFEYSIFVCVIDCFF